MKDAPDTPAALKARALRALARREHSRAELERKLAPHTRHPEALRALLVHLEEKKQLSNERFAEQRARVLARKYGAARIRHDLKAKGLAEDVIDRAMPADEAERARAVMARKYRNPPTSREERARRARFLQGRGFSAEVIHRLVLRDGEE